MGRKERQSLPQPPPPPPAVSSSDDPSSSDESVNSSSSEEEEEEEVEEENTPSTLPPPSSSAQKPPKSTTTVAALASPAAAKRLLETTQKSPSKKAKKEKNGSSASTSHDEGSKKQLFQRVFSANDEIEILKGLIEYKEKKGADPMSDVDDFFGFVKKSLHADVSKGQVIDKVRRLKKKYYNAKKKKITNPHELTAFELSKKIWGIDGDEENINKNKNNNVVVENHLNSRGKGVKGVAVNGPVSEDVENDGDDDEEAGASGWTMSTCDREMELGLSYDFGYLKEVLRKVGLRRMGARERAEMAEKWRKANMAVCEANLQLLDVIREATQRTLNDLKSDGDGH